MPQYNRKYRDVEQHVVIAWLIVLFAFVILCLIWYTNGIL